MEYTSSSSSSSGSLSSDKSNLYFVLSKVRIDKRHQTISEQIYPSGVGTLENCCCLLSLSLISAFRSSKYLTIVKQLITTRCECIDNTYIHTYIHRSGTYAAPILSAKLIDMMSSPMTCSSQSSSSDPSIASASCCSGVNNLS